MEHGVCSIGPEWGALPTTDAHPTGAMQARPSEGDGKVSRLTFDSASRLLEARHL